MPEIVKYWQKEGIIYVEGSGKVTYEDVKKTIEQGINYNLKYKVTNVLSIHNDVESVPEEVDVFNLGSTIGQKLKGFNIAIVYPPGFEEFYNLFANAANIRGGNVKLFKNKETAFSWLNDLKKSLT